MAFEGLSSRLQDITRKLKGKARITESDLKEMMREVKLALLEADVNYKVVKEFTNTVKEKALGEEVASSINPGDLFVKIVKDELTELLNQKQVDVGLIGIGENGHIAFNDPPADFGDQRFYKIVDLSDTCKAQQLREGWFATKEDVFKQAISMTCSKNYTVQIIH